MTDAPDTLSRDTVSAGNALIEARSTGLADPRWVMPTGPGSVPPPALVALPAAEGIPRKRPILPLVALAAVLLVAAAAGYVWWHARAPELPAGFVQGNGRLEADQIDIDTKFAGRVARLLATEGDSVRAGQVVAVMDTRDVEAQMRQAEALARQAGGAVEEAGKVLAQQESAVLATAASVAQARRAVEEAGANFELERSRVRFARQEIARTAPLVAKGYATHEMLDIRQQALDGALAAQNAASARVGVAEHALLVTQRNAEGAAAGRDAAAARVEAAQHAREAARQSVEFYRVTIADNALTAPRDGPIQYRVAGEGEVLPAGGRVFTMLDAGNLYMDVYLPTAQAGRASLEAEARIVLDADPDRVVPAKVVFVADRAQFSPKTVETRDERDKLMFRVRLRVDPERLRGRDALVRTGLPGIGVVRLDPEAVWPTRLVPAPVPAPVPSTAGP